MMRQAPVAARRRASGRPLAPGDAVGVSLIRGDLTLGATGTVTHVDGGRVYAFGHPFFNLGPTEFPMTRAESSRCCPSLKSSQKLAAIGDVVGTSQQDRATAIAGTLGAGPGADPVTLDAAVRSRRRPARSTSRSSRTSCSRRS